MKSRFAKFTDNEFLGLWFAVRDTSSLTQELKCELADEQAEREANGLVFDEKKVESLASLLS